MTAVITNCKVSRLKVSKYKKKLRVLTRDISSDYILSNFKTTEFHCGGAVCSFANFKTTESSSYCGGGVCSFDRF